MAMKGGSPRVWYYS